MYQINVRRKNGEAFLGTLEREPTPSFGSEIQFLAANEPIRVRVVKMSQYPYGSRMIDHLEAIEL